MHLLLNYSFKFKLVKDKHHRLLSMSQDMYSLNTNPLYDLVNLVYCIGTIKG